MKTKEIKKFENELAGLINIHAVENEWDEDKSCYVQWMRAEELKAGNQ